MTKDFIIDKENVPLGIMVWATTSLFRRWAPAGDVIYCYNWAQIAADKFFERDKEAERVRLVCVRLDSPFKLCTDHQKYDLLPYDYAGWFNKSDGNSSGWEIELRQPLTLPRLYGEAYCYRDGHTKWWYLTESPNGDTSRTR